LALASCSYPPHTCSWSASLRGSAESCCSVHFVDRLSDRTNSFRARGSAIPTAARCAPGRSEIACPAAPGPGALPGRCVVTSGCFDARQNRPGRARQNGSPRAGTNDPSARQ
jgi:hypothetical protein